MPLALQTLPIGQREAAQLQESGLSEHGLGAHPKEDPAPVVFLTQTSPDMHIDPLHGTAAHTEDCVDHTSFTHVASIVFVDVAHS